MQNLIGSNQQLKTFLNSQICNDIIQYISETGEVLPNSFLPSRPEDHDLPPWKQVNNHTPPSWMTSPFAPDIRSPFAPDIRSPVAPDIRSPFAPDIQSPILDLIENLLAQLYTLCSSVPLEDVHQQRFGNIAFRKWYDKAFELIHYQFSGFFDQQPLGNDETAVELSTYLALSLGNPTRLDYGTGHELNFLCLLLCLDKLGLAQDYHRRRIALRTFYSYLTLVRHVICYFNLEPAGSRGVWGLDDYSFLPFIWGAYQLAAGNLIPEPGNALDKSTIKIYKQDYLYFDALNAVQLVSITTSEKLPD